MHLCPCQSGKTHKTCCEPFLSGKSKALTVTQLMRSRFCAFALGRNGDYLFRTWHPNGLPSVTAEDLSEKSLFWNDLEIVRSTQSRHTGTVEFIAHFEDASGQEGTHHEVSRFVREKGQWLYLDGEILST